VDNSVVIKSSERGAVLELFDFDGDNFTVSVRGHGFHGVCRVYAYEPTELATYFQDLAAHWRGWSGEKAWCSLEGELSLSATSDSTGHTSLTVRLRPNAYAHRWTLSATLVVEAGQLETIAAEINSFLTRPGG
jgi:hypothetical protein